MNMMHNEEDALDMHFTMALECEDKHNLILAIKDIGCDICGKEHEDQGEFRCIDIGLISLDLLGSIKSIIKRQEKDGIYVDGALNRRIRNQLYYSFAFGEQQVQLQLH